MLSELLWLRFSNEDRALPLINVLTGMRREMLNTQGGLVGFCPPFSKHRKAFEGNADDVHSFGSVFPGQAH